MPLSLICPHCQARMTLSVETQVAPVLCRQCGRSIPPATPRAAGEVLEALPVKEERLQSSPGPVAQRPPSMPATQPAVPPRPPHQPNYAARVALILAVAFAGLGCCGVGTLGLGFFYWRKSAQPDIGQLVFDTKPEEFRVVGPVVKAVDPLPDPVNPDPHDKPVIATKARPIQPVALTGKGISNDWVVVFRSHDPSIWNRNVIQGPQHFAKQVTGLPNGMRYLRMRHDESCVIVETSNDRLNQLDEKGRVVWNGVNEPLHGAYHLGVVDKRRDRFFDHGIICLHSHAPLSGWGFGHLNHQPGKQGYCWNSLTLEPTVLEIAVKPGTLTPEEQEQLLPIKPKTDPIKPAQLTGAGISKDWQVIFCSADPSIWNSDVNEGANRLAKRLSGVANSIRYLRLRKDGEYVIVPMTKEKLGEHGDDGRYGWEGGNLDHGNARHLGVYDRTQTRTHPGDICVFTRGGSHSQGWGFGHNAHVNDDQNFSWNCDKVAPCVFEIAVKPGELTAEETKKLLDHVVQTGPIKPAKLEGEGISQDWEVIFCSANPRIWDSDVNKGESNFAKRLNNMPNDLRYLRIRRNNEYAIIETNKQQLKDIRDDGRYGWSGRGEDDSGAIHLGIYDLKNECRNGDICIRSFPWCQGWGFGHIHFRANVQGYCWNGKGVDPCVFEIAVKKGELTEAESKQLIKRQAKAVAPIRPVKLDGAGISKDWQVVFCSADPTLWGREVERDASHRAIELSGVAEDIAYLRLRKDDDYVIIPMSKERLQKASVADGYGWEGQCRELRGVRCLGVYGQDMRISGRNDVIVGAPFHRGWGFGGPLRPNGEQGYCWEGKAIEPCVFEIAVKKGMLTDEEKKKLLRKAP